MDINNLVDCMTSGDIINFINRTSSNDNQHQNNNTNDENKNIILEHSIAENTIPECIKNNDDYKINNQDNQYNQNNENNQDNCCFSDNFIFSIYKNK